MVEGMGPCRGVRDHLVVRFPFGVAPVHGTRIDGEGSGAESGLQALRGPVIL